MKYIQCNTPKGQYLIPLKPVLENRADYYICKIDGLEKDSNEYKDEVEYFMSDNYEGIDWLLNNTDWEDWENIAIRINDKILITDSDFWTSSDSFEIIEREL